MKTMPEIATAAAHFTRCREAERGLLEAASVARAKETLATPEEREAAAAEASKASAVWYDQYRVAKQAAIDLLAALDINAADLKDCL